MKLLDLYCKQGGASRGYADAGFEVIGVDIEPQPLYPYDFTQADALEYLRRFLYWVAEEVDAIHASPPCQAYSTMKARHPNSDHPELIGPTRELLEATGLPYVIENVEGARSALKEPTMLCGSAFGLPLRRHRLFETNFPLMSPGCAHGAHKKQFKVYEHGKWRESAFVPVYGHGGGKEREAGPAAMGISWMDRDGLTQAIPPAMTQHIGEALMTHLTAERKAAA